MARAVLTLALTGLLLAACGKKEAPTPAGPPEQVVYPKIYPTQ